MLSKSKNQSYELPLNILRGTTTGFQVMYSPQNLNLHLIESHHWDMLQTTNIFQFWWTAELGNVLCPSSHWESGLRLGDAFSFIGWGTVTRGPRSTVRCHPCLVTLGRLNVDTNIIKISSTKLHTHNTDFYTTYIDNLDTVHIYANNNRL